MTPSAQAHALAQYGDSAPENSLWVQCEEKDCEAEMSFGDELASPSAYEEALSSGAPRSASKLPLIASGLSIVSSFAIYLIFPHDAMLFSIIGYLLTPIAGALSLAWGQALDVSGRRDVWYSPSSSLMMVLKIMAVVGFVIGLAHMWDIASIIAASVAP